MYAVATTKTASTVGAAPRQRSMRSTKPVASAKAAPIAAPTAVSVIISTMIEGRTDQTEGQSGGMSPACSSMMCRKISKSVSAEASLKLRGARAAGEAVAVEWRIETNGSSAAAVVGSPAGRAADSQRLALHDRLQPVRAVGLGQDRADRERVGWRDDRGEERAVRPGPPARLEAEDEEDEGRDREH